MKTEKSRLHGHVCVSFQGSFLFCYFFRQIVQLCSLDFLQKKNYSVELGLIQLYTWKQCAFLGCLKKVFFLFYHVNCWKCHPIFGVLTGSHGNHGSSFCEPSPVLGMALRIVRWSHLPSHPPAMLSLAQVDKGSSRGKGSRWETEAELASVSHSASIISWGWGQMSVPFQTVRPSIA